MNNKLSRRDFLKLALSTISIAALEGADAAYWPTESRLRHLADPQIVNIDEWGYLIDPEYSFGDMPYNGLTLEPWPTNSSFYGLDGMTTEEMHAWYQEYFGDDFDEAYFSEFMEEWVDPDMTSFEFIGMHSEYWVGVHLYNASDPGLVDDAGLALVEGEYPGSSFCGVKLRNPLPEANMALAAHGLNMVFVNESDNPSGLR